MGKDFLRGRRQGFGVRPVFEEGGLRGEKPDYKTAALCKQVGRAVSLALAGECADPVLQGLQVEEVLAAPNAGRLLVRVRSAESPVEVLPRLEAVKGLLRASVAEAIARKRTPELMFEVMPLLPRIGEGGYE